MSPYIEPIWHKGFFKIESRRFYFFSVFLDIYIHTYLFIYVLFFNFSFNFILFQFFTFFYIHLVILVFQIKHISVSCQDNIDFSALF